MEFRLGLDESSKQKQLVINLFIVIIRFSSPLSISNFRILSGSIISLGDWL
jgi:hypothetical protein